LSTQRKPVTKSGKTVKKASTQPVVAKKAPAKKAPASVAKRVKKATAKPVVAKKVAAKKASAKPTKVTKPRVSKSPGKTAAAPAGATKETTVTGKTTLRGRSVFVVQTTNKGVVVRSAWLSEDRKLREMPAVFPEVDYALAIIDDLRKQVLKHFSQAARVGARAIASQRSTR
jgi:hypothetical protein